MRRARLRNTNNNNCISHTGNVSRSATSGYDGSGESTTVAFIPPSLREILIQLLDIDMVGTENWEYLAEHLGYKPRFIRWLKHTPGLHPTDTLLTKWESEVKLNPTDALAFLQQILLEMKRLDAANEIQNYLSQFVVRKETVV